MEAALALLSSYSQNLHKHWLPVFNALIGKINQELLQKTVSEIIALADMAQKDITRRIASKLAKTVVRLLKENTP